MSYTLNTSFCKSVLYNALETNATMLKINESFSVGNMSVPLHDLNSRNVLLEAITEENTLLFTSNYRKATLLHNL